MKSFIILFFLSLLLASCAPSVVPGFQTDPAQQRHIAELESQLESQRHVSGRWQVITVCLSVGGIALLILGTSLGAKTRHDATALS